ncbi:MAG TPA: UDP-glucose/GDP-mannose dehydrogenase family protein [Rhabdochlamydiaceae bacterium]|jgi:UDPglucose 6-dehydrogenase|nr:UDP-glucose/GDP-mannose dehydrogenase family protein [Rhabdochlamydiaceae bacterium]
MITVIGLGFVGLTTALGFSSKNFKVFGIDSDKNKTALLKNKKIPFFEAGMEELLVHHLDKKFIITDSLKESIKSSQIIFLCVGTPCDNNGDADLKYIYSAIDDILRYWNEYKVLVIKSTVPPSTTHTKIKSYLEARNVSVGKEIGLVCNPEFLREGTALDDFMHPDRIVIGTDPGDDKVAEWMQLIYKSFNAPLHFVSLNTAEFIKYLSNSMLATMISYANEMSMIADEIGGIDVRRAFNILHEDRRWYGEPAPMAKYVYPGCGFGGYCLPKDTQAMLSIAKDRYQNPNSLLSATLGVNRLIKKHSVAKILTHASDKKTKIGILGLSFKPNSDDVRDTPAAHIISGLIEKGYANISAYDPLANQGFQKHYPDLVIDYVDSLNEIMAINDILVIVTACDEFKNLKHVEAIEKKCLVDLRYTNLNFRGS